MARVSYLNLHDEYVEDRDTRPIEPGERKDLFNLFLKSDDKSVDIEISVNVHPGRKFIDPTLLQFRTRQTITNLCWHVGFYLPKETLPAYSQLPIGQPDLSNSASSSSSSSTMSLISQYFWNAQSEFFVNVILDLLNKKLDSLC